MASVRVARNIAATPERVWPYLAEAERWPDWMPGLASSRVTNGRPEGVGRHQHLDIAWGGHRGEIDLEITEWVPNQRIGWVHLSDRVEGMDKELARNVRTLVTLAPAQGGATLSFEGSWEPVGFLGKMLSGTLVQNRAGSTFQRAAENLERLARGSG
jgi:uncharacterized protein YndB with AHSA1/START domain